MTQEIPVPVTTIEAETSLPEMDDIMALFDFVHDHDNHAKDPAHMDDVVDQQALPNDSEATDAFDFDELLNLEDSPDQICDADSAPKHQYTLDAMHASTANRTAQSLKMLSQAIPDTTHSSSDPENKMHQETLKHPERISGKSKNKSPNIKEEGRPIFLQDNKKPVILQFSSSQEANDYRPDRKVMPTDPTIPRTTEQKRHCVISLIKAMKSVENATDNWGMIKPFAIQKFSNQKIEVCCWNILDCCIVRQTVGPFLTPEEEILKNKTKKNKQTFQERFQDMIDILTVRKTVCRHLLDPYYLLQFVDDPSSCLSRVDSNKTLNAKKKQAIDEGKKVIAKKIAKEVEKDMVHKLASPFATPKPEVRSADSGSRHQFVDTIEIPRMHQSANVPLPNINAPVVYPPRYHPHGPVASGGTFPGYAYAPNYVTSAWGKAPSPSRPPWNHHYSNDTIMQYEIAPRTPQMMSMTSHYPTPPFSGGQTPSVSDKSMQSYKRSSDGHPGAESPTKKGRH